jgi:hypothetical protein
MAADPLQQIIGRAIVDRRFCDQLLRDPTAATGEFGLSAADGAAIAAIRAPSLEHFATKVDQIRLRRGAPEGRLWRELRDAPGLPFRAAG